MSHRARIPTYPRSIWRLTALLIIVTDFVKIVFIQLADKTRKIAVLEMFGQDGFGKSFVLRWTSDYRAIGEGPVHSRWFPPPAPQNYPPHRPTSPPTNRSDPPAFLHSH